MLSHVVKWIPEKKIGGDANGDHCIATHRFQPGPPFAARVVPTPVVTDNREAFKKSIFAQVFYGENCYRGRLTRLFAEQFPTVWETIQAIKKPDYRRLSHHMLRLEAEVVINRAVRQCALEGVWVVTIHDCLVTTPEQVERVKQIMTEAFGTVGAQPTIKVTAFD